MFHFTVNGAAQQTDKNERILTYLRETLRLTSVKNGCSEGACGTCMILVDGKATKSCVLTTERAEGKSIVTVEGFTPREKNVYAYAFVSCGAVQCGFCTPGMLISAKGLIDANPN
ncbi:MAG: 2Fe-2S iron-sulfur cluster-binding protein, partial [Ruthenibacterium sp.]